VRFGADVQPFQEALGHVPCVPMNEGQDAEAGQEHNKPFDELNGSYRAQGAQLPSVRINCRKRTQTFPQDLLKMITARCPNGREEKQRNN
jgi:hypothetical protein